MNSISDKLPVINVSENDFSRIGDALIANAILKKEDVERILARQLEKNILFGQAAKELGLLSESELKKILSEQFGYAYVHEGEVGLNKSLFVAHQPFSSEAEKIRSLRGQLLIQWFDLGHKLLAVSSVNTEDRASHLLANLAIVFSQLNKKTLLIDANLRQPNQHQLFGLQDKMGLANILANRQGQYQLTPQKSLPNLTVLSAGTEAPNPQELLSRESFTGLLADLENLYDIILIDTAPSNLGMDYLTVVSRAKAVLVVACKDTTRFSELKQLKTQIETTQAKIIGSVIQEM